MQSTNKPNPPVPSSMDVCEIGGSGPPRLQEGGAIRISGSRRTAREVGTEVCAICNVRALLEDEHVHELEEELK